MVIVVDTQLKLFIRTQNQTKGKLYFTVNSGCMLGQLCVQQEIGSFAVGITSQIVALVFLNVIFNTHYLKLSVFEKSL